MNRSELRSVEEGVRIGEVLFQEDAAHKGSYTYDPLISAHDRKIEIPSQPVERLGPVRRQVDRGRPRVRGARAEHGFAGFTEP